MMRILHYILVLIPFLGYSQVTIDGTVSITSNTTVSTNHDVTLSGTLINDGTLDLNSALTSTGTYNGAGGLTLSGTDQSIDLEDTISIFTIMGGGIKTLASPLWVAGTLDLTSGVVVTNNEIQMNGGIISNASAASYINGKLIRSGASTLDFPVGSATQYLPVTLRSISGANPQIGILAVEADPTGTAGNSLLDVSSLRYWVVSDESGTFDGAIPTLPVINESVALTMAEISIATGSQGGNFTGLGKGITTGDLSSGTITALASVDETTLTLGRYFNELLREADSAALRSIYTATSGDDWIDNTGWMTGELDAWQGVTIENKRPVAIDLTSNNLSGSFPEITSGLDSLKSLSLAGNSLTDLPDLSSLPILELLSVENNALDFTPIESNLGINNFSYAPQDSLLTGAVTIEEIGTVYQLDRTIGGSANTYAWSKKNLDGTFDNISESTGSIGLSIVNFEQDGKYYAAVTSSVVPDLTLYTRPVFVKVASLERDHISLMAMYNATGGTNWVNGSDWASTDISAWEEVTITQQRVTAVTLPNNNMNGVIPSDLEDVKSLEVFDVSGNNISGLPDLNSLPALTMVDLSDNNLEFDDLEPIAAVNGLNYSPQKEFGLGIEENIPVGSDFMLSESAGGSQNTYQWKLDDINGNTQTLSTGSQYNVLGISYETMGTYYTEVINPLLPALTLKSKDKQLLATANITFTAFDNTTLVTEGVGNLLGVVEGEPYDSILTVDGTADGFVFNNIVLGDYVAAIEGPDKFLATYFTSTDLWTEATIFELRANISESIELITDPGPEGPGVGFGSVIGLVEAEFADEADDGRVMARRKVKKAGCSLRRRTRTGGGRSDQDEFVYELYAYVESNDNGDFEFGKIEEGNYRINIEYPGVPMDESSFVEFEITSDDNLFIVEAYITEDGVEVTRTNKLGIKRELFTNLNVYPVPADEYITVTYEEALARDITVKLIDLNGQTLYHENIINNSTNQFEINTSGLDSGIYMLLFSDPYDRQTLSYKIVVTHK